MSAKRVAELKTELLQEREKIRKTAHARALQKAIDWAKDLRFFSPVKDIFLVDIDSYYFEQGNNLQNSRQPVMFSVTFDDEAGTTLQLFGSNNWREMRLGIRGGDLCPRPSWFDFGNKVIKSLGIQSAADYMLFLGNLFSLIIAYFEAYDDVDLEERIPFDDLCKHWYKWGAIIR